MTLEDLVGDLVFAAVITFFVWLLVSPWLADTD